MVNEGQIKAKINSEQQTIAFIDTASLQNKDSDDTKDIEYLEVIEELEQQNRRIIELMEQMETVSSHVK